MREYIELHPHAGSPVIRRIGATIVRDDDEAPVFSDASGITVVEITGRTDGPFPQGNLYNTSTDVVLPPPPPPPPAPPTRAQEIIDRDISVSPVPTNKDIFEACQEILKALGVHA